MYCLYRAAQKYGVLYFVNYFSFFFYCFLYTICMHGSAGIGFLSFDLYLRQNAAMFPTFCSNIFKRDLQIKLSNHYSEAHYTVSV